MEGKESTKSQVDEEEIKEEDDQNGDIMDGNKHQEGGKDSGGADSKKKERSFSQEQVNRMMTREKNQGRAAAFKEMGIDPKNTKMVKMFQAFIESQKSDEQKAAEKDAEAQRKQGEAEHRALVAEAKSEAMMLGVKSQYVDDAVTLALPKVSDSTDLKTVLSELKEKYGMWFDTEDDESGKDGKNNKSTKTGQKGTGATIKDTNKKTGKESGGFGARLAASRKPSSGKTSYWGGNR